MIDMGLTVLKDQTGRSFFVGGGYVGVGVLNVGVRVLCLSIMVKVLNKHRRARPCKSPQPYDPDFGLSVSNLFGICHKEVWIPT